MKTVIFSVAVASAAACAATAVGGWRVPGNWEVRISEKGAVQEWTGKTWCGHVQGMCATSNALYFAFHNQIVKTDWYGRLLKRADNLVKHTGDICCWNGRLYTIICHAKPVEGVPGSPASIQVFDEDLNIVKTKTFTRVKGEGGDTFFKFDRDFKLIGKYNFGWKQGVDVVPGGKDGAVRFIYCSTPNWLKFQEKPMLPVHALILFAELKGDSIRDITRHCVFKNPLPR